MCAAVQRELASLEFIFLSYFLNSSIIDGLCYAALQHEVASLKLNGFNGQDSDRNVARGPPSSSHTTSSRDMGDEPLDAAGAAGAAGASLSLSPFSHSPLSLSPQDKKMLVMESSLEEAKTSNRLLSRALSAVQVRLKHTEAEREQLRRERDYFRNLALRFPFTLSAGGYDVNAAASFARR